MKTISLKTNIMCGSCVAKVTPYLNEAAGAANRSVNTQSHQKVLTVSSDTLPEADVIKAVEKAGFKAERFS